MSRLTFADDLAHGIVHLLRIRPEPGVYNLSGGGEPITWAEVAKQVFALAGHDPDRVRPVSTAEYLAGRTAAPRPASSVLDLGRIERTGWTPPDQRASLAQSVAAFHRV